MKNYDVIVIGSGGGAKITSPAARLGLKVAVIEKDKLGGTCLNRGCIPSKMLIHPADVADEIKHARKFNINASPDFTVDFDRLVTRISQTVDRDSDGIVAGYKKNPNIEYLHGTARFVSNKIIRLGEEELSAGKIFLAGGARPQVPNIPGLEGTPFMTSTEALRNIRLPKKLVVIGASYIACELGHAYGALGSEVHFLVRSRFLRHEDEDIQKEFTRAFSQKYHCHLGCVPLHVSYAPGLFSIAYRDANDKEHTIEADALLIATGVIPNSDTLALENTDISLTEEGFIRVDERLETEVPGIYALGDCIGKYFFRHSVNFEGEYLFRRVFIDNSNEPIRYPPVGHAVFTNPQVAGVGKTQQELDAEEVDYVVGTNPYAKSAQGMARLSDEGFAKLLIEAQSGRILGAHIIGPEASNMIHTVIAFMTMDGTLDDLLKMIYIHPALPEIVRNAARKAKAELEKRPKEVSQQKLTW